MLLDSILLNIEGAIAVGFFAGLVVGLIVSSQRLGCGIVLAVPVAMIIYISSWQDRHPENLTSTSALDFMFGPLWPSLGALAGIYAGRWLRTKFSDRTD